MDIEKEVPKVRLALARLAIRSAHLAPGEYRDDVVAACQWASRGIHALALISEIVDSYAMWMDVDKYNRLRSWLER